MVRGREQARPALPRSGSYASSAAKPLGTSVIVAMSDMLAADPSFSTTLRAARIGKDRRLALRNARLTTRLIDGSVDIRMIASVEDARDVLANAFGIALPNNDRLDTALEAALAKGGDA